MLFFVKYLAIITSVRAWFSSSELSALRDFYNATNGDKWEYLRNPWNFDVPTPNPCVWSGITCYTDDLNITHVATLILSAVNLNATGTLPPSMANFTEMTEIMLINNCIQGTIPIEMMSMTNLAVLYLSGNQLNGSFPAAIEGMTGLYSLQLDHNGFYGSLPDWLFQHPHLNNINVAFNNFTGSIPFGAATNTNLQAIYAFDNLLNGTISEHIGNYPEMLVMVFDHNYFSGSIPPSIAKLSKLGSFSFAQNNIDGSLPEEICQLNHLNEISLSSNSIEGSLPDCMGNLTHLVEFQMDSNHLTGWFPKNFTSLPSLNILDVDINHMSGPIEDNFPVYCPFASLDLSYNHFSGTLPLTLSHCSTMTYFHLEYNAFDGPIPDQYFEHIFYFTDLDMSHNHLTGTIPADLQNGVSLTKLNLEGNQLEGGIPPQLSNLKLVALMSLGGNHLSGTIPMQLGYMYPVLLLSLSNNVLTGTVPSTFSQLVNLELLFICNNALTGSIEDIFDSSKQQSLMFVDVSKNQFTSNLPKELFSILSLKTFTALSNCFSGPLPVEMCGATNLTSLVLDGLMSATSCQKRFFKNFEAVVSYGLSSRIPDGIPECLFTLPKLETLHLSGNGLTGSLPHHLEVSKTLTIMSLSHNSLQGSIPLAIRDHVWNELDLSYNKISGTLTSTRFNDDVNIYYYTNLALQVNRLSGAIPASLIDLPKISMLDGNLFQCDADRSDLPRNDPNIQIFSCGSSSFNDSLYLWCAVVGAVILFFTVIWGCKMSSLVGSRDQGNIDGYVGDKWKQIRSWLMIFQEEESEYPEITSMGLFTAALRSGTAWLTAFVLCILLPTYLALSHYYDTYTYEYAWYLSGAYWSGVVPAVLLFLLLLLFTFCCVSGVRLICHGNELNGSDSVSSPWYKSAVLVALVAWNILLVTGVNIAYVYIDRHYSSTVVQITQVFVAVFKVSWNNFVVQYILEHQSTQPHLHEQTRETSQELEVRALNTDKLDTSLRRESPRSVSLAVFVMLFNNIAAPFIATGYVSSNCFYDIVTTPSDVSVTYTYAKCTQFLTYGNSTTCYSYDDGYGAVVSYPPPFLYSYQCASTFITTYANIFILMLTIDAFFIPLLLWTMKWLHNRTQSSTFVHRFLDLTLPKLYRLTTADLDTTSSLFRCDGFVVKLINIFAVFCTFGVILPPVALICCVTMFSVTYYNQVAIGRILCCFDDGRDGVASKTKLWSIVDRDCQGAAMMFGSGVHMIVPFAAIFFGLVLFDTLGDAVGWQRALVVPLLMCTMPMVFYLMYYYTKSALVTKVLNCLRLIRRRSVRRTISRETGVSQSFVVNSPEYSPLVLHEGSEIDLSLQNGAIRETLL